MSCRTPVISSLKRIWIGWLISNSTPGIVFSTLNKESANSQYPTSVCQSSLCFIMINTSVCSGLIRSVGTSAVPVFPITMFTSWNCISFFSTNSLFFTLAESELPCGRMLWKAKSPSSNCGMNSPPIRRKPITLIASNTSETTTTDNLCRSAPSSAGA